MYKYAWLGLYASVSEVKVKAGFKQSCTSKLCTCMLYIL